MVRSTFLKKPGEACALAALVLLGGLVLYPVASAGFVLADDHEILSFTPQALSNPELSRPPTLLDRIFVNDPAGGRVRPLYYVIRYAEIALLDAHPQAWHLFYIGLGVASAAFLYATLRNVGIMRLPALLGAGWLIVAPGVSSVWIRLGPQESLGTVLLLVAVWAMTHGVRPVAHPGWNWIFVGFASASTLVKESFMLIPPALVALRLLLLYVERGPGARNIRSALWPAVVPVAVSAAALAAALLTVQLSPSGSYGGRFLARPGAQDASTTSINLQILAVLGGALLPLLALGMLIEIGKTPQITSAKKTWCAGATVACLIILPQLVLYHNDPGFRVGRYILPAGLGLAGGFAAGSNWLRVRGQRILFVMVAAVWMLILCLGSVATWFAAESLRGDSVALSRLVEAIARAAPPGAIIAIAADPATDFEFATSLPYQLAASGRPDLDTRLIVTPSDDPAEAGLAAGFISGYFPDRADLGERGCADIAAVVIFSEQQRTERALPCLLTIPLHLESFSETVGLGDGVPAFLQELFPPMTMRYSALFR